MVVNLAAGAEPAALPLTCLHRARLRVSVWGAQMLCCESSNNGRLFLVRFRRPPGRPTALRRQMAAKATCLMAPIRRRDNIGARWMRTVQLHSGHAESGGNGELAAPPTEPIHKGEHFTSFLAAQPSVRVRPSGRAGPGRERWARGARTPPPSVRAGVSRSRDLESWPARRARPTAAIDSWAL